MKKISVGEWVICDNIGISVGEVIYVDEWILVVRKTAGNTTTIGKNDLVCFVGDREKVLAMEAKIEAMSEQKTKAVLALQAKINKITDNHKRAVQKLLSKKLTKKSTPKRQ